MAYVLIPDGFALKKVSKAQKDAVDEYFGRERKGSYLEAFLSNETTPVLIGATGLIAIAPILAELFFTAADSSGISISEQQKETIKKAWLLGLPGIGPIVLGQELFERFVGDKK